MPDIRNEIANLVKARAGIIWIRTREELRAERLCLSVADSLKVEPVIWRMSSGFIRVGAKEDEILDASATDPRKAVQTIEANLGTEARTLYVLEDFGAALANPAIGGPVMIRRLKDALRKLPSVPASIRKGIVVIDQGDPPPELGGVFVLDLPLPDSEEIGRIVDDILAMQPEERREESIAQRGSLVSALTGLEAEAAAVAVKRSIIAGGGIPNPVTVLASKKALLGAGGAVEWFDPDPRGLDGVGGLDNLKKWLSTRRKAFSPEAKAYGLPMPKGCLIVGIPGTGKSLMAKCTGSAWSLPLLKLDLAAIFGKYVGESEANLRAAIRTIMAVAPAVVWIDEVEKGLAGSSGGGEADGGTTVRVFGQFLTFLQEASGIFVIATANNVEALPPELTRAGRFDAIWFVDLPNQTERRSVVRVMAAKYPRAVGVDVEALATSAKGLTGAEIEEGFRTAMNIAFEDGMRDVATKDVVTGLREVVPITRSFGEKLKKLREWAKTGARPASLPENDKFNEGGNALDL
ncbi:MAG: AAA family ATPase [Nitrospirota bacterium]